MTERLRVALLEGDGDASPGLTLSSEPGIDVVTIASDRAVFIERVGELRPDVAVLDLAASAPDDIESTLRAVAARAPNTCPVVIVRSGRSSAVSRAVLAGARGLLVKPYQSEELITTVTEAFEKQRDAARGASDAGGSRTGSGTVVAVYGPKGGVGTTTVAANLAVALAEEGALTALVDLDLQFGDVGIALDLKSANSVADLLAQATTIDDTIIDDIFVRHRSGLRVLLAPDAVDTARVVRPEQVTSALDALRAYFDHVVCDLWSSYDGVASAALAVADVVLLVTTPELASLKDVQRVLTAGAAIDLPARVQVVVTRSPGRAGLSVTEVERGLGRRVAATIPSDGIAVTRAMDRGIPVIDPRASAKIGQSYRDLVRLVRSVAPAAAGATAARAPARA